MKRLYVLTWCSVVLAGWVFFKTQPQTTIRPIGFKKLDQEWLLDREPPVTPKEHRRAPDQTFLTYPEWFLVFGPAEYAEYLQQHTSTNFPLITHIFQAWESYQIVDEQIRDVFPPNDEYHTMIKVINTSSTVEFGAKAIYEALVGQITDVNNGEVATEEDRFNARYTSEYITFLDTAPWYEFDYLKQIKTLWGNIPILGLHPIRKLERRYFLSTELSIKAIYGWLIKIATKSAYETPSPVTAIVLDKPLQTKQPDIEVKETYADSSTLVTLPRYTPLTPLVAELSKQGFGFREIAGNRTAILVSAVGPSDWRHISPTFKCLFSQPIPTKLGMSRWVLATPVSMLNKALMEIDEQGITLEHVFDY